VARKNRSPVDFRHGIGPSYAEGDRALNAAKRREAEVGSAAPRPGDRQGDLGAGDDLETFRKKFKEHLEAVAPVDKDSDQK
jgi:hypothetical protein